VSDTEYARPFDGTPAFAGNSPRPDRGRFSRIAGAPNPRPTFFMISRPVALAFFFGLFPAFAPAAPLSPEETKLVSYIAAHREALLADLDQSVAISSATEDIAGVQRCGALLRAQFDELGFATRWIDMPAEMKRAGHLVAERTGTHGKRLLLIGHLDTVLPSRTARREGDKYWGSGTQDMKGGNIVVLHALKALHSIGALDGTQLIVMFTGDEESAGHPLEVSRRDLIEAGHRSDCALAFEAAVRDTVTIARRGASSWQLEVTGVQAHSAGIFSAAYGDGAVFEAARILNEFREKLRASDGLTFNPALIAGGTDAELTGPIHATAGGKTNVIARHALVRGDLRFQTDAQLQRARAIMKEIVAHSLPRTSATITFVDSYPAMAATPASHALYAELDRASRDLGFGEVKLLDPKERGAGDVSFVAPFLPSLDGLGARGQGAHTPNEFADTASFPELVERTALLIYRLTR
jgi:glutamate carboxypeptidase